MASILIPIDDIQTETPFLTGEWNIADSPRQNYFFESNLVPEKRVIILGGGVSYRNSSRVNSYT